MVGCVIVKDGKVVGEGFHPKAGQPHAEVFALREAGDLAENATAYVSLEPCNHYGRTPPCTEALIRAKVKRVVVGMVDPNPIVASKGLERLKDSGIEVKVGVEEELCKRLNEVFIHHILTRKPFVTLRYSISMDGNISDGLGKGAVEFGGYYSQLLQEYDGIILSSSSLNGCSCLPLSQEPQCKQPKQMIVASSSNSPVKLPLLDQNADNQPIIFTDKSTEVDSGIARHGIETVVLDELRLGPILDYCERLGLCSVLLDVRGFCGIFEEFVKEGVENGLLQKVVMEVLPVWNGSREVVTVPAKNFDTEVRRLAKLQSRMSNGNHLVEGYF
ncbi:hypothetical protein Syun_013135 [Stephania yunnanensis]|uniref:diaminohydroxyphosphoribosylaminopyrimidine deaminase n=1 Tax=Stephania yunnanensis TaxID=152371 RepID=A0AAP0K1R3_9MAGN